ncbi:MAG: DUF1097 domain-containing protein [Dysgonamonadaceae bacterium]|jgi:hypothetical protein|nr:DUF1097 domain-containing protein [Dysgonamonadaceae bacterium]
MKNLKKFVMIPVIIGILAFLIQALDQILSPHMSPEGNVGFSWISFQSWAVYFLAGCNLKGGIKAFLAYVVGIGGSILIMELGGALTPALAFWGVPLAVGVVAFAVIFFEKVDLLSLIPGLFIGAGAFFAFMSYVPGATYLNASITELTYCAIGLIFGIVTVYLRVAYEKRQSASNETI